MPVFTAAFVVLLAPIIIVLVSLEWSAVPRESCNWDVEQFCTDYKGLYGLGAICFTIVLIIALLVINRDRSSYRSESDV